MAELPYTLELTDAQQVDNLFDYLEVRLASTSKQQLIKKLLASNLSQQADLEVYATFSLDEEALFLRHDYKSIWLKNFQELNPALELTAVKLEQAYKEHLANLEQARQAHLKLLTSDVKATGIYAEFQRALLYKKIQDSQCQGRQAFLLKEKEKYYKQYKVINKLYKITGRIEGICHHVGEELPEQKQAILKAPSISRWAHYLAHDEHKIAQQIEQLDIGLTQEEKLEKFEHYSEMAGIFLRTISIVISLLSLSTGNTSGLFSEATKDGIEQTHLSLESASMLVTGITLMLKGEKKLGAAYLLIGTVMACEQLYEIIADFGVHMLSSGLSTAVLGFVSAGCCLAMAAIEQYQIKSSQRRIVSLETNIADLDEQLSHNLSAEQKAALLEERTECEKVLLLEKAKVKDLKNSRNLWIASSMLFIAAGTIAMVGLSVASMGVFPLFALAVAAAGIGLAVARHYISGDHSYTEKLKEEDQNIRQYTDLLQNNQQLSDSYHIDLNAELRISSGLLNQTKVTTMRDYLRDLVVHQPQKAEQIIKALDALADFAKNNEVTKQSSQKDKLLNDLKEAMNPSPHLSANKSTLFNTDKSEGALLYKAITAKMNQPQDDELEEDISSPDR